MAEMKTLTINGEQFTLPFAPSGLVSGLRSCANETELNNVLSAEIATMGERSVRYFYINPTTMDVFGGVATLCELTCWTQSNGGYGTARFMGYGSNTVSVSYKSLYAGTWHPFAWDNPPMVLGVEYRTTERIEGKAVYKKRDSSGNYFYRLDGSDTWIAGVPGAPAGASEYYTNFVSANSTCVVNKVHAGSGLMYSVTFRLNDGMAANSSWDIDVSGFPLLAEMCAKVVANTGLHSRGLDVGHTLIVTIVNATTIRLANTSAIYSTRLFQFAFNTKG